MSSMKRTKKAAVISKVIKAEWIGQQPDPHQIQWITDRILDALKEAKGKP